jgi:sulfofructose kinase
MTESPREVLVIGHAALDLIFRVPRMPLAGQKQPASDLQMAIGGPAVNAAIAIERLGGRATLLARVGDDAFGDILRAELARFGVNGEFLCRVAGATSSVSSVYVDDAGERQVVNVLPASLSVPQDLGPVLRAADRRRFDAVLGDSRWPQASAEVFAHMAGSGVPLLVDFERPDEALLAACRHATHVFFSQEGLRMYTDCADPLDGLRLAQTRFDAVLGVTVGERGVYWLDRGQMREEPAFPVQVRETLAAGDVWHGVAALALGQGLGVQAAIRRANAVAALKCTRTGGSRGMPEADQIRQFLEQVNA